MSTKGTCPGNRQRLTPRTTESQAGAGESKGHPICPDVSPGVSLLDSFGLEPRQHIPQNPNSFSAPEINTPYPAVTRSPPTPALAPSSIAHGPPPPPKRPSKRRRPNTPPKDPQELVIGSVLSSGKFTCQDRECKGLTFGRLADLRRHWGHTHVSKREEYFCNMPGCGRADKNTGGKGRSFGNRKDKRDEHMRNVHDKNNKKRSASDFDDEDEDYQL